MPLTEIEWKAGDRVIHPQKPEWGVGSITAAQGAVQDGRRCQRLTVRFENGGLKTVSTAFAKLSTAAAGAKAAESSTGTWLDEMENNDPRETLITLPESATDPFSSNNARLAATLDLYRFSDDGASLLTWASAQTGLTDPLSRLNRHELEAAFQRFRMVLDRHLGQLVNQCRREGINIDDAAQRATPDARRALQRINRPR